MNSYPGKQDDSPLFRSAEQMHGARNYHDWTFSLFAPYLRGRVLEVGCGVGSYSERIVSAEGIESLLAIDISEDAVSYCAARFRELPVCVEHLDLREVSGSFDLIVCINVLEHIENDGQALRHLLGLLAPGGVLFLLVPAHQALYTPFDVSAGHFRRYSRNSMAQLMKNASAPECASWRLEQHYFNFVGALGYWWTYRVMGKQPTADASAEIGLFDRFVVPIARRLESRRLPFGISLVSIMTREA